MCINRGTDNNIDKDRLQQNALTSDHLHYRHAYIFNGGLRERNES